MNERKLYEWIKATPENLPNDKDENGAVLIHIREKAGPEATFYNSSQITVNQALNRLKDFNWHFEYLREVDLKWPSEPAIKEEMLLSGFTESDAQNAYEHGFRDAIQWLQQQLKK